MVSDARLTRAQCYTDCIMTAAPEITASAEPRPSLRERKKLATRRALRRAALDLVAERGFTHVTVEDIAEAADVSPRTFFNYFPSKEAAVFGSDTGRTEALRLRLIEQSPGESALEALRVVLIDEARARSEELRELGSDPASQLQRMKASHQDPHLSAARAAHMAMVECVVADALAERLGADPEQDPYPLLLAMAAMGMMRAAMSFWASSGGAVPLDQLVDSAARALADGLPENCALRGVVAAAHPDPRKDSE
jgi:AcrR family transcriptional regulator